MTEKLPVVKGYDPFKKKPFKAQKVGSQLAMRQMNLSIKRFLHYVNSNQIRSDEITKFRPDWTSKILELVPNNLLDPVKVK